MKTKTGKNADQIIHQLIPVITSDNKITIDEMDELYQLFALFDYASDARVSVLNDLLKSDRMDFAPLEPKALSLNEKLILAKNLMKFQQLQSGPVKGLLDIVEGRLAMLKLPAKVMKALRKLAGMENAVLSEIKKTKNFKELGERIENILIQGFSAGVPLGMLYLFGITGLSAAGITSGLAVIGSLAGLGFSPMIGGLAVLFSVSIAANKTISRHILPFIKKNGPSLLGKFMIRQQTLIKLCEKIIIALDEDIAVLKKQGAGIKYFIKRRMLIRTLTSLKKEYKRREEVTRRSGKPEGSISIES